MISFLVGILVALATFYVAFIYASPAIGLLAFAQSLLLALAFLFLTVYRRRLDAYLEIPLAVAEKGGQVSVQIVAVNRNRIPCMRIRYKLRVGSTFVKKGGCHWQHGAAVYAGENKYQALIWPEYAGSYTIELVKLRIYDLTGLFYIHKRIRRSAVIQVLPEAESVAVRITERTRNFFGDSDVYDDFRPGDDRSEIFDIRDFRPGDKIQSIHWKLSAKTGELVVREDSLPRACPLVLILENGFHKNLRESEVYLSAAASLSFSLMDARCPHYVSWYSGSRRDMVRVRVDDEEGYYLFLSAYLEDCFSASAQDAIGCYREKYRYDRQLYMLWLRPDLSLWQNEDKVGQIDRGDWKSSVQKLELIL